MSRRVFDRHATQSLAIQAACDGLARELEIVDGAAREQPLPHVQALRDRVEREGDKRLGPGFRPLGVRQRPLEQRRADAASLFIRRHEQLGEKPQVAARPAEGEAQDFAGIFRHPQAIRVVLEREPREHRRTDGGHRAEAVAPAQLIDAGDDELTGAL